jgi:two-component system OmpR family sensor kinase
MSIRTRLTLWYSSLLAIVLVVFGLALFSVLNWAWRDQIQSSLMAIANQVSTLVNQDPSSGQLTAPIPPLGDSVSLSPYYAQVWSPGGRLISTSDSQYQNPLDPMMLGSQLRQPREFMLNNKHYYVLTVPFWTSFGGPPGSIQVATRLDAIDQAGQRLLRIMIGVGIAALLLTFGIGSLLTGQALQPIDTIAQTAARITAADDLSRRIPYDGPDDELGQLITTFNATLERLERLFNAQRRFVADVSHELRTPLTTIQGNLDLIQRMGSDPDSMNAMRSEVNRMARLIGDLLLLARADSGNLPMNETTVDLDSLVMDVFQQGRILGPQLQFKLETLEPVRVRGDADRLKQLLLNLVTNAIKYTPAGGTVTMSLTLQDGMARASVSDTGIGIPKSDLESIFDRFYRVDKARSRDMGGTGLGLSIAQWIARSHHGRILAESEEGKGSTFTLYLPALSDPRAPESAREARPRLPALRVRRTQTAPHDAEHTPEPR